MATNIAIVGYGNIGRAVYKAIQRNPDMHLEAIITRRPLAVGNELPDKVLCIFNAENILNIVNLGHLKDTDVAILCGGSKNDLPKQGPFYAEHFNTVDSFDTHANIPDYFAEMDEISRANCHTSIISAGWDPGTFSVERVLQSAFIPGAKPQAFYGLTQNGGLSMGHSDAIRTIPGVRDARQYTHAIPDAIKAIRAGKNPELSPRDKMWRECFVVLEKDTPAARTRVAREIQTMPGYFEPYITRIRFVDQKELDKNHSAMPHDGLVISVGETGNENRAMIEYRNEWQSNPEATGSILVACARACYKLSKEGRTGAFTMLDIPPSHYSPHSRAELLKDFM